MTFYQSHQNKVDPTQKLQTKVLVRHIKIARHTQPAATPKNILVDNCSKFNDQKLVDNKGNESKLAANKGFYAIVADEKSMNNKSLIIKSSSGRNSTELNNYI
jgi:hypothetical protein